MHNEPLTPSAAAYRAGRKSASRAVVPVTAPVRTQKARDDGRKQEERAAFTRMPRQAGALAGFVTQLIACADNLPAYRARRRAEPQEAARRYAGVAACPAQRRGIAI